MIGNDIVDLALAQQESNWQRKGFLDKIFTPQEQQLIRKPTDPDQMVWLLWSMKESAYKIAVRISGNRCFAPAKLACDFIHLDDRNAEGIVRYGEKEYLTKSSFTPQYIATVSINKEGFLNCRTGILPGETRTRPVQAGCPGHVSLYNSCLQSGEQRYQHLPYSSYHSGFDHIIIALPETSYAQPHHLLWKEVKQHCAATLSVPEEEIHLHKDEAGAPWLMLPSAEKLPLSVSHHGRFGAFVFSRLVHSR